MWGWVYNNKNWEKYCFFQHFQFIVHQLRKNLMLWDWLLLYAFDSTSDVGLSMVSTYDLAKSAFTKHLIEGIELVDVLDLFETFEVFER